MNLSQEVKNLFNQTVAIDIGSFYIRFYTKGEFTESIFRVKRDFNHKNSFFIDKSSYDKYDFYTGKNKMLAPMKEGYIADFTGAEQILNERLKSILKKRLFNTYPPHLSLFAIPNDITEVNKRAIIEAGEHTGARKVSLIHNHFCILFSFEQFRNNIFGSRVLVVQAGAGLNEMGVIKGKELLDEYNYYSYNQILIDLQAFLKLEYKIDCRGNDLFNILKEYDISKGLKESYNIRGLHIESNKVEDLHIKVGDKINERIHFFNQAFMRHFKLFYKSNEAYFDKIILSGGMAEIQTFVDIICQFSNKEVIISTEPRQDIIKGLKFIVDNHRQNKELFKPFVNI